MFNLLIICLLCLGKLCPKCNSLIIYKNKKCLKKSIKKNQLCRRCSRIGIKFGPITENRKNKIIKSHKLKGVGLWMRGRKLSNETKIKQSMSHKGIKFTGQHKEHIRLSKLGDKNPSKRFDVRLKISNTQKNNPRTITDETKHKISIKSKESFLKRMEKLGIMHRVNFNPQACKYFDKLNEERKWNLQHALNGGEKRVLCYFLDAYDKDKNIVIEYDEPHHYDIYGQLKEKDKNRMKDIIKHLNCKFYRYNEKFGLLYEGKVT